MSITKWNPFAELNQLEHQLGHFFNTSPFDFVRSEGINARTILPRVDIKETDQHLHVYAEIPGVKKDDIEVKVEGNLLTISVEKRFEDKESRENYRRIERQYGSVGRAFTLPEIVDTQNVEAAYKDGVLEVKLKKIEKAQPKNIKVA